MADRPLDGLRVLISGAGIAGPATAWWLAHHGAAVTVVEVAPALRTTGFAVDFRGETHFGVLEKMGVLDDLRAVQTGAGAMLFVDEQDKEIFLLPPEFAGGELEVMRRDLSRVFYEHTRDAVEYVFGDTISELTETPDAVLVDFALNGSREFDLVVGADGLHSVVRRLAMGDEAQFVKHLNYYIAGWDMPNEPGLGVDKTQVIYNEPGRMTNVMADQRRPDRRIALVIFASPRLEYDWHDVDEHKKLVTEGMSGAGWHTDKLLGALADADELYFDSISRVYLPHWSKGRVVLIGDAAYGVTLGGMGVGTSVVGAHILAGELVLSGGDHKVAFAAYEKLLRGYTDKWQRGSNPGEFMAPSTNFRLNARNWTMRRKIMRTLMIKASNALATNVKLPDYPA
ncbi:FAD-dependent monooxygenase [Labedaea rhizosphaerae]|uniref:2-polyprenyl-6-methoxyphenol hydroxylase-like FAD-dependent oxidoreductase n=1 Tax=Labedaea rhizosphaerae TaxID=598644 RepID=A0A4R6SBK8_LABRH|nr:FAD-dependent monooxygenase [Labedaea rhizosphaerae]TDP96396.1 2-polyprenyl-6-methoxyphenol hydroxylase-like FAD-dependent oxidoreductase [Labedaea rhizosphaerae]